MLEHPHIEFFWKISYGSIVLIIITISIIEAPEGVRPVFLAPLVELVILCNTSIYYHSFPQFSDTQAIAPNARTIATSQAIILAA